MHGHRPRSRGSSGERTSAARSFGAHEDSFAPWRPRATPDLRRAVPKGDPA